MFWSLLLLLFSPWYLLLGRLLRDDRDRQILLLHQQLLIALRQLGKRPRLRRGEKLALVLSSLGMKTGQLLDSLVFGRLRHAAAANQVGYRVALWSANIGACVGLAPEQGVQRMLKDIKPGAIVLLHNGPDETLEVLPGLLAALKQRGYTFGLLSQAVGFSRFWHPGEDDVRRAIRSARSKRA